MRNRFYHPTLGRWQSRDPLYSTIGLYEYADSSVTGFVDPLGLQGAPAGPTTPDGKATQAALEALCEKCCPSKEKCKKGECNVDDCKAEAGKIAKLYEDAVNYVLSNPANRQPVGKDRVRGYQCFEWRSQVYTKLLKGQSWKCWKVVVGGWVSFESVVVGEEYNMTYRGPIPSGKKIYEWREYLEHSWVEVDACASSSGPAAGCTLRLDPWANNKGTASGYSPEDHGFKGNFRGGMSMSPEQIYTAGSIQGAPSGASTHGTFTKPNPFP